VRYRDLDIKAISDDEFDEETQEASQVIDECSRANWNVYMSNYPPQPKDFRKRVVKTAKDVSVDHFAKGERILFESFLRQNNIRDRGRAIWSP